MQTTVAEIAEQIQGRVIGDGTVLITNLNGLHDAQPGDLAFLGSKQYIPAMQITQASAVIVPENYDGEHPYPLIKNANPYLAFAMLLHKIEEEVLVHPRGFHPSSTRGENVSIGENCTLDAHTHVADNAIIGDNVILYAGVYIGRGSCVGEGTVIYPNTTVRENCTIGKRCIIHSNVSIGSDGFGFTDLDKKKVKIPQIGTVQIGDDVEIGSNSSVDRATCGQTRIGNGTKLDNLVQIAHNVTIGDNTTISGMSCVAGSAKIGSNVTIGGASAIIGHITIADGVVIAGRAGVTHSVNENEIVSGFPATNHKTALRILMSQRRLPQALQTIRDLEKRIEELEKK
jgi:UDP-3-O-[3-hydroxymyristoyl] glucosamine N-acyltransferase